MNYNDVTVWQYQQMINLRNKKDNTFLDNRAALVAILNNMTEVQVDSLSKAEFNKLSSKLDFLNEDVDSTPTKYIDVNGKRYKAIYDVSKMPFARYIETKVFGENFVDNLHKLAATMFMPQKRNIFGIWVNDKYDAGKHEEYSNDMLSAKFKDVYGSLVFFYQVYRNWIEVSRDYLENNLIKQGMTKEVAKGVVQDLCNILDGSIPPKLLPITKILEFRKHME